MSHRAETSGTPSGPRRSHFWIYDGDRHPVIVEAPTRAEAVEAVKRSPMHDGFGMTVVPIELFARYCQGEITEPEMYQIARGEADAP